MRDTIEFYNLPFEPVENQVIYVEPEYNTPANDFITDYYDSLVEYFKESDEEFIYLPILGESIDIEACVRYYAPYIQNDFSFGELPKSDFLLHLEHKGEIDGPAFIQYIHDGDNGGKVFRIFSFDTIAGRFIQWDDEQHSILFRCNDIGVNYECCEKRKILESGRIEPYKEEDVKNELRTLENTVNRLKLRGVPMSFIHEFIDREEKLSRLVITADNRIFLPDYGNKEVVMSVGPKTLFFLFLRYPEGIVLKELQDHYNELYNIYCELKPNFNEERVRVTITEMVNPIGNSMNENMSRIRAAFVKLFDERLAKNYFVTGKRGEAYSITLDRDLVEWQE